MRRQGPPRRNPLVAPAITRPGAGRHSDKRRRIKHPKREGSEEGAAQPTHR